MKLMSLFIVATVISLHLFAADDTELPLAAKNVISTMERKVADIRKKAVQDLKSIMKKEAQAGRMDKATLLNDTINEIEAEIEKSTDKKSNARYDDIIIGKWSMPIVKYEITFEKGHRFSASFNDNVKWQGNWIVEGDKLIVNHPINNSTDTFDLPPKREMEAGRNVYKLYGHTDKGEGRMLVKAD